MSVDELPDPLTDHIASSYVFDPWERFEELHSSVVVLQPAGVGVTIIKTDEPTFSRPSAVVE